jgi:hypothetical protein
MEIEDNERSIFYFEKMKDFGGVTVYLLPDGFKLKGDRYEKGGGIASWNRKFIAANIIKPNISQFLKVRNSEKASLVLYLIAASRLVSSRSLCDVYAQETGAQLMRSPALRLKYYSNISQLNLSSNLRTFNPPALIRHIRVSKHPKRFVPVKLFRIKQGSEDTCINLEVLYFVRSLLTTTLYK